VHGSGGLEWVKTFPPSIVTILEDFAGSKTLQLLEEHAISIYGLGGGIMGIRQQIAYSQNATKSKMLRMITNTP
jgi:hypothetical protein